MKITIKLILLALVIFGIAIAGCSKSNSPLAPSKPGEDNPSGVTIGEGVIGEIVQGTSREVVGTYLVEIDETGRNVEMSAVDRIGAYHFNLTKFKPNVLWITSYGNDPGHGGDFYIDVRMKHPYPGSGIDAFDARVIAALPADDASNTITFPTLQVVANNKVVMDPDGYTQLYDNLGLSGNTNPFMSYFKDKPYRRWSSTGTTEETRRWYINLDGFAHGIKFYLVCDVCTRYPNPPTPRDDNAPEPVKIDVSITNSMYANGGYADITATIFDWQGFNDNYVQVECPELFNLVINLQYKEPGIEPDTYVFEGEIGNYNEAPSGVYQCLVYAFDSYSALGIYTIAPAIVNNGIEPVVEDAYYDFSTIDIKEIHVIGTGFCNDQDSSVVWVDGQMSGFTIESWRFDEIEIQIPNDNRDHIAQMQIDGLLLPEINLLESSTILLVYNANNSDSVAIKNYYVDPVTGRDIKAEMALGLPLSLGEQINRTQYDEQIKMPIETYILDNNLKYRIKYIVLAKGIPLKIQATGGSDYTDLDYAALDTELTLIFNTTYSLPGRFSSPYYGRPVGEYFHPFKYSRGTVVMAYLVTRLAAWTTDEVYGMIDRAKNPYSGSGAYGILDGDPGKYYDRMEQAETIYLNMNIQHVYDNSNIFVTAATIDNPTISQNIIAYTGHGVHHNDPPPGGGLYIYELRFGLLNGAIFNSYESFNCTSFNEANRSGHGMVGDWIRIGGTGGIGHVYEPWSDAVGDERMLYPAQVAGNNLAEACYLATKYLSWTETIVGDPLVIIDIQR